MTKYILGDIQSTGCCKRLSQVKPGGPLQAQVCSQGQAM